MLLDLQGSYQCRNIVTASAAIDFLHEETPLTISRRAYLEGMCCAAANTALMGRFAVYAEPVVIVFGVVVLLALLSAVMLYSSYYLGGRSIYLMRRLPDGRQTLRRQVWTAPLLWAVSTVVLCALVLGLCYGAWYCITPSQCLPTEENVQRVMNAIASSPYSS